MRARLSLLLVMVLVSTLSLGACRGGGDENALAGSFLLTLEDFPDGWQISTEDDVEADTNGDDPYGDCPAFPGDELRGRATTPDFVSDFGFNQVSQTVAVFESPEGPAAAVQWLDETLDCRLQAMNQGRLDGPEAKFSDGRLEVAAFEPMGDTSRQRRMIFTVEIIDPEASGTVPIVQDYVVVTQDRFWFIIEATGAYFPTDLVHKDLLPALARKTVDRMTGAAPSAASRDNPDASSAACDRDKATVNALAGLAQLPGLTDASDLPKSLPAGSGCLVLDIPNMPFVP